jgi:hypothetical protein
MRHVVNVLPPPSPIYRHRDDVWVKESWVRFVGLTLKTRMVVLRVAEGLLLYSPSPAVLDEATAGELDELGKVRWLVAPNEIHTARVGGQGLRLDGDGARPHPAGRRSAPRAPERLRLDHCRRPPAKLRGPKLLGHRVAIPIDASRHGCSARHRNGRRTSEDFPSSRSREVRPRGAAGSEAPTTGAVTGLLDRPGR